MNYNENIFQYFNQILCVRGVGLIKSEENPSGLVSKDLWDKWIKTGANLVQRGGNGRVSLIEFDTIPHKYKQVIIDTYGNPREQAVATPFKERLNPDPKAVEYYSHYRLADGRYLPENVQKEYALNAAVLNTVREIYVGRNTVRVALGGTMKNFWKKAAIALNHVRKITPHTLSGNSVYLKRQYDRYLELGYEGLISGKYCNQNRRKVNSEVEHLLMSLYSMPNKPFATDVHQLYTMFLEGKIQVVDRKTGEMFDPENFKKDGYPREISRSTVWNYINDPKNRAIVDRKRSGQFQYQNLHRPHNHRHKPKFSFSKISLDDLDLPRKLHDGSRVKTYRAYDVASTAIIGVAYSRKKDEALFLSCLKDIFRLIDRNGWGWPMEVEVENHLVRQFEDELEAMFPFVRWCNAGNSQEKHAEHNNRAVKYGVSKKNHQGIGRWWAKGEAYRVDVPKVNDEYAPKTFDYDRLVADDVADCREYNNQLHPNQKRYPGKTRWQVLCENLNPNLPKPNKVKVIRSIGEHTKTTINRNQYCTVQYEKYMLPSPKVIGRLAPNNYEVEGYYLRDEAGIVSEIFLFQNGEFICKCEKLETYNTARAERTEKDEVARLKQNKFTAEFDKMTKDGKNKLSNPVIYQTEVMQSLDDVQVVVADVLPVEEDVKVVEIRQKEEEDYEALAAMYVERAASEAKNL